MEIVSEGGNPNDFGFTWNDDDIERCRKELLNKISIRPVRSNQVYIRIQESLENNKKSILDIQKYRWLQKIIFTNVNEEYFKQQIEYYKERLKSVQNEYYEVEEKYKELEYWHRQLQEAYSGLEKGHKELEYWHEELKKQICTGGYV